MLAEWQRAFADAVRTGAPEGLAFAPGPVAPQAALAVHRNTITGALVQALRLTYPSVDLLVGEDYFDQTATAFVKAHPPVRASLAEYGTGFPEFLGTQLPEHLSYIAGVARFDLTLDRAPRQDGRRRFMLDADTALELPAGLAVLVLETPADLIRDALGDDAALAAIDPAMPRRLLIWREEKGVMVRPVSAASAAFMASLQRGETAEQAFAQAREKDAAAAKLLQAEIFAAPFAQIISTKEN